MRTALTVAAPAAPREMVAGGSGGGGAAGAPPPWPARSDGGHTSQRAAVRLARPGRLIIRARDYKLSSGAPFGTLAPRSARFFAPSRGQPSAASTFAAGAAGSIAGYNGGMFAAEVTETRE